MAAASGKGPRQLAERQIPLRAERGPRGSLATSTSALSASPRQRPRYTSASPRSERGPEVRQPLERRRPSARFSEKRLGLDRREISDPRRGQIRRDFDDRGLALPRRAARRQGATFHACSASSSRPGGRQRHRQSRPDAQASVLAFPRRAGRCPGRRSSCRRRPRGGRRRVRRGRAEEDRRVQHVTRSATARAPLRRGPESASRAAMRP